MAFGASKGHGHECGAVGVGSVGHVFDPDFLVDDSGFGVLFVVKVFVAVTLGVTVLVGVTVGVTVGVLVAVTLGVTVLVGVTVGV